MRLSTAGAALFAAYAAADATEAVSSFETFCPSSTTVSHGSQTVVVSEPTTVTFTSCDVTRPLLTKTVTECNDCNTPTALPQQPSQPFSNSTSPCEHTTPPATGGLLPSPSPIAPTGGIIPSPNPSDSAPIEPQPPIATGAGSRAMAGAGAGLAAVLGVAAFVL